MNPLFGDKKATKLTVDPWSFIDDLLFSDFQIDFDLGFVRNYSQVGQLGIRIVAVGNTFVFEKDSITGLICIKDRNFMTAQVVKTSTRHETYFSQKYPTLKEAVYNANLDFAEDFLEYQPWKSVGKPTQCLVQRKHLLAALRKLR